VSAGAGTVAGAAGVALIVDDEIEMARVLADHLGDLGWDVLVAASAEEALRALEGRSLDVLVTDLKMGALDGIDLLRAARAVDPGLPVIVMTAFGGVEAAVEAMRHGALHYVRKPLALDEITLWAERARATRRLGDENRLLARALADDALFAAAPPPTASGVARLLGRSAPMRALVDLVRRVAPAAAPVLIEGESGTGKELVARALHEESPRAAGPFVALNCAALPDSLVESELFGHVRGAYTGARDPRRGLFAEADGGTLFLDEIAELAPPVQAKLLRALEEGEVRPVGADAERRVDVRVVAATHRDLAAEVAAGRFRADLFYRLDVVRLRVPPLRERLEDLPLLAAYFLSSARTRAATSPVAALSHDAVAALARHRWPGNVRELENVIERLVVVAGGPIVDEAEVRAIAPHVVDAAPRAPAGRDLPRLRAVLDEYIRFVVAACDGNKTRAAVILGIDVSTIHRRESAADDDRPVYTRGP